MKGVVFVFKGSYGIPVSLRLPATFLGIIGGSPDDLGTICTRGCLFLIIEGSPDGLLHLPSYSYEIQAGF